MPESSIRPEKLSRKEIADVLRRNCMLYQKEENFIDYLVDLALYLLEFQYDPKKQSAEAENLEEDEIAPALVQSGARVVVSLKHMQPRLSEAKICPVCGVQNEIAGKPCKGCGLRFT